MNDIDYYWEKAEYQDSIAFDEQYQKEAEEELLLNGTTINSNK